MEEGYLNKEFGPSDVDEDDNGRCNEMHFSENDKHADINDTANNVLMNGRLDNENVKDNLGSFSAAVDSDNHMDETNKEFKKVCDHTDSSVISGLSESGSNEVNISPNTKKSVAHEVRVGTDINTKLDAVEMTDCTPDVTEYQKDQRTHDAKFEAQSSKGENESGIDKTLSSNSEQMEIGIDTYKDERIDTLHDKGEVLNGEKGTAANVITNIRKEEKDTECLLTDSKQTMNEILENNDGEKVVENIAVKTLTPTDQEQSNPLVLGRHENVDNALDKYSENTGNSEHSNHTTNREGHEVTQGSVVNGGKADGTIQMDYRTGDNDADGDDSEDDESDDSSDDEDTNQDAEKTINKSITSSRDLSPERKVKLNRHGFEDLRTKGEIMPEELPPLEELTITVDETVEMEEIGTVSSVVGVLVIVQSSDNVPPLNDDTILFVEGHKVMGQVFEVFGPVKTPWYSVRFNETANIEAKGIQPGTRVFCAPKEESFTKFVFVDSIKKFRGSDASWTDNNEPPEKHLDYSDDEEEKRAKAKRKSDRKAQLQGTDGDTNGDKDQVEGTDTRLQQKKGKWQSWPPRDDTWTRENYRQDQRRGHEAYEGHKKQWVRPSHEQQNFQTWYNQHTRMNVPPQNNTQMSQNTPRYRGPPPRFGGPPNFQNQQRFVYQNNRPFNARANEHPGGFGGNQQNFMTGSNQFSQQRPEFSHIDFNRPPPLLSPPTRFEPRPLISTNIPSPQVQQPDRMTGNFQQPVSMQNDRNNMINNSVQSGHFSMSNQPGQMRGDGVNFEESYTRQSAPFGFNNVSPGRPSNQNDGPFQPMSFNNNNVRPLGHENSTNGFKNVMFQGSRPQESMNTIGYQNDGRNYPDQGHLEMTRVTGMDTNSHGQVPGGKQHMVIQGPHGNQQPFMMQKNQQERTSSLFGNQDRMIHGQPIGPSNQADRMNQGPYMMQGNQPQNMSQEHNMLPDNHSYRVNQVPLPPHLMRGNHSQRMNQEQSVMPGNQPNRINQGPHPVPLNAADRMTGGSRMLQRNQTESETNLGERPVIQGRAPFTQGYGAAIQEDPRANQGQGSAIQGQAPFIQGQGIYRCNDNIPHDPRHMPSNNMNTPPGQQVNMAQNNVNSARNGTMNYNEEHMQAFRNDRNSMYLNDNRSRSTCEVPLRNGHMDDTTEGFMNKNFHNNSPQYNEPRLIEDPRLIQGR